MIASTKNKKILVIEDEPDLVEIISYNLNRDGFKVIAATRGDDGLELIRQQGPALVILDLMLPGIDGLEICQRMKADRETSEIPIIMVSARGEESDVVLGLGLGADDYLPKPFSPRELLARVKAVLRRGKIQNGETKERVSHGDLSVDRSRHEVKIKNQAVELTATEFRLLFQLASSPGRVFSREQLLNHAIGDGVVVIERNIDVHVRAIRKKLDVYGDLIETVRGIGYRFNLDNLEQVAP